MMIWPGESRRERRDMVVPVFVEQGIRSRLPVQFISSREGEALGTEGDILGKEEANLGKEEAVLDKEGSVLGVWSCPG